MDRGVGGGAVEEGGVIEVWCGEAEVPRHVRLGGRCGWHRVAIVSHTYIFELFFEHAMAICLVCFNS